MTRRHAAWLVARASATLAGQNFFSSWLKAAHEHNSTAPPEPERWTHYEPQFFSQADFALLERITEILIPADETPGAREAHVAPFIDFVLFSAAEYSPETQAKWRAAIDWLRGQQFADKNSDQQVAFLHEIANAGQTGFETFQLIKDLTVYSFYTSRVGMIDNLEYKGLAYLTEFPGCSHPEHRTL